MYLTRNRAKALKISTNNEDNEDNEDYCLICWEPSFPNENNSIFKMKEITFFNSDCKCDCKIHLLCFFDWFNKTHACPICRETLTINEVVWNKYKYGDITNQKKVLMFFQKTFQKIKIMINLLFKYIQFLFLLHISIKIIVFVVSKF